MRSKKVWLIDKTGKNFNQNLLLNKRAVLEVFLFFCKIEQNTPSESCILTANDHNVVTPDLARKVKTLYLKYHSLEKLKYRNSPTEIPKRKEFAIAIELDFAYVKSTDSVQNPKKKILKEAPSPDFIRQLRTRKIFNFVLLR